MFRPERPFTPRSPDYEIEIERYSVIGATTVLRKNESKSRNSQAYYPNIKAFLNTEIFPCSLTGVVISFFFM